ncbi:hypothetical protein BH11BAC3_BH11BAC3_32990 [soil metagenome]
MARKYNYQLFYLILIILLIFLLWWLFIRPNPTNYSVVEKKDGKFSWNVLFKEGTSEQERNSAIKRINTYINDVYIQINKSRGKGSLLKPDSVSVFTCKCDSLLYNIDFNSIDGEGRSVTTGPATPVSGTPGGAGDYLGTTVSDNSIVSDRDQYVANISAYNKGSNYPNSTIPVDSTKILAIIDSGFDTTKFTPIVRNYIWKDNAGSPTLYNFLPGQSVSDFSDQTVGKHGSAVMAIAIKALAASGTFPRIMILKALNENNKGSIFSVSCALKYAMLKKATVVNLSLGYLGAFDSILHHYISLTNKTNPATELFIAAGNSPEPHNNNFCDHNPSNLLTKNHEFYPACFSPMYNNITTVTQISTKDSSCNYQYYSDIFVNVGIYDSLNCCTTPVRFQADSLRFYEGTSFATPAASGMRMSTLLNTADVAAANQSWNMQMKSAPKNKITVKGHYISYSPSW